MESGLGRLCLLLASHSTSMPLSFDSDTNIPPCLDKFSRTPNTTSQALKAANDRIQAAASSGDAAYAAGLVPAGPPGAPLLPLPEVQPPDTYKDRLVKYIPSEIVLLYLGILALFDINNATRNTKIGL